MFSILSSKFSRNMCKSRCKLRNTKIYPIEVQILQIIFSWYHFLTKLRQLCHISEPTLSKQFFSKLNFLFSFLGSMLSNNICKLRHKLKKRTKIYPKSLGHDKINLDLWKYHWIKFYSRYMPMTKQHYRYSYETIDTFSNLATIMLLQNSEKSSKCPILNRM